MTMGYMADSASAIAFGLRFAGVRERRKEGVMYPATRRALTWWGHPRAYQSWMLWCMKEVQWFSFESAAAIFVLTRVSIWPTDRYTGTLVASGLAVVGVAIGAIRAWRQRRVRQLLLRASYRLCLRCGHRLASGEEWVTCASCGTRLFIPEVEEIWRRVFSSRRRWTSRMARWAQRLRRRKGRAS